jgi:7-cyano-7-deazaguanine synthase
MLSGGFDSTVLAAWKKPEKAYFVDYGQPASKPELHAAHKVAKHLGIELEVINVTGFHLGSMADPTGNAGPRVVAARNLLLVSIGTNRAAADGLGTLMIGATSGDRAAYADCRAEFFDALSALSQSTCGVKVAAPLVKLSKVEVAALAMECRAPIGLSWSCYTPNGVEPCGACNACAERSLIFDDSTAGVTLDPCEPIS